MKKVLTSLKACFFFLLILLSFTRAAQASPGATLSLSPASGSYASSFDVNVILDTGGELVVGADIYLNFEPSKLSISESDIRAGTGLSIGGKSIDEEEGLIKTTVYNAEEKISGSAVQLATLTFTPQTTGDTTVTLKFGEGQTSGDCTVAQGGVDILSSVSGATYTLSATAETHKECRSGVCVGVSGAGPDECSVDTNCQALGAGGTKEVTGTGSQSTASATPTTASSLDFTVFVTLFALSLIGSGILLIAIP